jgi:adenosylcobinamide-GDP ribazoletransferase
MREALAFLTVLPVGARSRPPGRAGLFAFPLVGLALGGLWALVAWAGSRLWGPWPAAAAVILVDLGVTGALHLDAVADLADGWASRRPPEEALAIMRDPSIGAVGAAALAATLLVRWSFIAALATGHRWPLLVVAPIAGRAAMVWVLARSDRAAGIGGTSLALPLLAAGRRVAPAALLLAAVASAATAGLRGVGALLVGIAAAEGGARWARRRFGGVAGDIVGAVGVAGEILALAVLSAHIPLSP